MGENRKKAFSQNGRKNRVVRISLPERKNPSSKEEEGKCFKKHTFPPFIHEEAPSPIHEQLHAFLDFGGRNPPTVTHQEHRVTVVDGKPKFHDSPELAKARSSLCARLEKYTPDAPFEGPLALSVAWLFSRNDGIEGWKVTRPDTDNLEKLLKDCMTRMRFWLDDAQVCDEHVFKRWSRIPGIAISIRELNNEEQERNIGMDIKAFKRRYNFKRVERCCGNCKHFEREYEDHACTNPHVKDFADWEGEFDGIERLDAYAGMLDADEGCVCDLWEKREVPNE